MKLWKVAGILLAMVFVGCGSGDAKETPVGETPTVEMTEEAKEESKPVLVKRIRHDSPTNTRSRVYTTNEYGLPVEEKRYIDDMLESTVVYTYDENQRLLSVQGSDETGDGFGDFLETYDEHGYLISLQDRNDDDKRVYYYHNDVNGNYKIEKSSNRHGNAFGKGTAEYDDQGRLFRLYSASNYYTEFLYDANGTMVKTETHRSLNNVNEIVWWEEYIYEEKLCKVLPSWEKPETETIWVPSRIVTDNVIDGASCTYTYHYDNQGHLIASIREKFEDCVVEYHQYDAEGRLESIELYRGTQYISLMRKASVSYNTYDDQGFLIRQDRFNGSDEPVEYIEVENDADGNMLKGTTYDMAGVILRWSEYTYDDAGRCLTETAYDAAGNLTEQMVHEYDAEGNHTETVIYDGAGAKLTVSTWIYETVEIFTK